MLRWILPVVLSVLGALGFAWLFGTKQGTRARRQLTKQGQLMLKQGERTLDQVSRQLTRQGQLMMDQGERAFDQVSRQVQGGAQELLKESRQIVNHVSR